MAALDERKFRGGRLLAFAGGVAVLGWAGLVFGYVEARRATCFAYLTAFAAVTSVVLGALCFLMIHYAAGARWNTVIRRLNEGIVGTFAVLLVLFVPIAANLSLLYTWVEPPQHWSEHALHLLEHKRAYLNPTSFIVRTLLYFAVWLVAAEVLRRWSLARDSKPAPGEDDPHARERTFSIALLPLTALALTFAAFDWVMSLDPLWYSTIFGVYYFAGGFVACTGLLAVLAYAAERSGLAAGAIRPPHFHALGRLMLAFTIFWAYCAFFQAMLIQIADRPEEIQFYLRRLEGGWKSVAVALGLGRFLLPFLLLLPRAPKFRGGVMATAGAWILAAHYLDVYWLVAPAGGAPNPWLHAAALAAVAGTSVTYATLRARGRAIVPFADPAFAGSVEYRSPL